MKFYPGRGNSIGITMGKGYHHFEEAGLEIFDGLWRNITGRDNVIYNMHGNNAQFFLNHKVVK